MVQRKSRDCEFYDTSDTESVSVVQVAVKRVKIEWPLFRNHMDVKCRQLNFPSLAQYVLKSETCKSQYPNITKLVSIALCIPVSTADCERGFAKYNLVKTSLRSRLQTTTVCDLMRVSVDTPSMKCIRDFDFDRAFDIWAAEKARRINQQ